MSKRNRQSKRRVKSMMSLLFLTAILLIASTYAWFSANRVVTINKITAKVTAAEGLQISLDGLHWSSTLDLTQANLEAALALDGGGTALTKTGDDYNQEYNSSTNLKYCLPKELVPVSASGATNSSGQLQMVAGTIANEGKQITVNASAENDQSKYICFDMFLKNSSTQTEDILQLEHKSNVGNPGAQDTGLEFSSRVGFVFFGTKTTKLTETPENIRALGAGTPVVSIWEPNNLTGSEAAQHIGEVASNDRRITLATDSFLTLPLLSSSVDKTVYGIDSIDGKYYETLSETPEGATEPVTLCTSGELNNYLSTTTKTMGTGPSVGANDLNMTAVDGTTVIKLPGNSITKVRVYIWLEGQDPDCIDTASTGKSLDFNISLTKPVVE